MSENSSLAETGTGHFFKFVPLDYLPCAKVELENAMRRSEDIFQGGEKLDGILFYHKLGAYTSGYTPLATWLKPHMLPDILNVSVPEEFLKTDEAMEGNPESIPISSSDMEVDKNKRSKKIKTSTNKNYEMKDADDIGGGGAGGEGPGEKETVNLVDAMTFQPNLVVPTVLWGQHAPTHCPSVVTISKDMKTIASGSLDGQVILWEMDPKTVKITPRLMLMGHNAPVLCFASASHGKDMSALISAAENGEMCLWDLQGGRCVEHTKSPNVHINFTGYYVTETNDYWLLANGYYPGVQVINPTTLQVLFTLTARISADWISALTVVKWAGKN
ncbi:unnamed protein product, partial [Notodromas monacha]